MGEGEFALIRHHLEQALHPDVSWAGDHDIYATLTDAAAMHHDEAAIRRYAPLAEELAARHGHVLYRAIADRALGVADRLAGAHSESYRHLTRALDLFSSLDTQWQIGRTLVELGELAHAQADTTAARHSFGRALAAFGAVRAAPDIARTLGILESLR